MKLIPFTNLWILSMRKSFKEYQELRAKMLLAGQAYPNNGATQLRHTPSQPLYINWDEASELDEG